MGRATSRIAAWRGRLLAWAERTLPALTRLRRPEALPILLDRRRIYVLPTGYGLVFALLTAVMLTGALNYGNNPALLLTCLLGGACFVSVFVGFRALSGLRLVQVRARACHAGEAMPVELVFAADGRDRLGLRLSAEAAETVFAADRDRAAATVLAVPTRERGWFRPGRVRVSSSFPLGMFTVWSWINPDASLLVYPRPEADPPPLPRAGDRQDGRLAGSAEDEPAGLRDYREHDPPRRIAWRASARHATLLVRDHERQGGTAVVLDYHAVAGLDHEARIGRLTAWVLMAEAAGEAYALAVPGRTIGPALGAGHRAECLRALALLPAA
ncbi:DUF58 domain-containing protein [Dokdonella koreensis]|uniref:Uncharacterized protein n=1 Tax=Dokdonella koreensis DS-123 TaxID=1300342 RepID=A0A160DVE5_9GAMM|nr:DUF58 domain-containing protein [Dokdonella koreensis]ANB18518.1 Hypothetical protein I596_2515 [Dokdonella koreensis DS-123]